jgi:hypothetical protein
MFILAFLFDLSVSDIFSLLQPAASLQEEYPHISLYLRVLTGETGPSTVSTDDSSLPAAQPDLDAPTDELMLAVRSIMERSERGELTEQETDDQLREVVERVVAGQVDAGVAIGEAEMEVEQQQEGGAATRTRTADELEGAQGATKRTRDGDNIGR